ncbi:MAG: DUF4926 domain-containing protein [Nanoarchaeota archaeon]
MHTKFKRHQAVRLLRDADPEYVEYHNEDDSEFKEIPLRKGMKGRINVLLSNGRYHVEVFDEKGNTLAYVPMNEEDLEAIEE